MTDPAPHTDVQDETSRMRRPGSDVPDQTSAYRADNMALNFATFIWRRRFSLGFSKCRWFRTSLRVPSRSTFFFSRRNARSTGSPFFSLTSLTSRSHPFATSGRAPLPHGTRSRSLPALPVGDPVRRIQQGRFEYLNPSQLQGGISCNGTHQMKCGSARPHRVDTAAS